jgi:electron transfer flavoprotein alpha subunit
MERTILFTAEHSDGAIKSATYEAAACARELASLDGTRVKALIIGEQIEEPAQALARTTGFDVVAVTVPGLTLYTAEAYLFVLRRMVSDLHASFVACPGTVQAADFAPALAARIRGSCITGVQRVFAEDGAVGFSRSVFGGKVVAHLASHAETTVLTVQSGSFKPERVDPSEPGSVESVRVCFSPQYSKSLQTEKSEVGDSGLQEADTIIAVGRGIGKEENLRTIERLASLFPRSAVAGSRPVCDAGLLEHKRQVGMTGAVVSPKLYVACGISGAVQHLHGMRGADFIVAINKDPNAAIFNESDVCVVEDLETFLPVLIDRLEQGREA